MIISTLLKIAFIYSAFVFIKSLLRTFLNSKIDKAQERVFKQRSTGRDPHSEMKRDYAKSAGKVVDAEYKVLKD